ncbi:MAG TPA: hypothetical protein DDZ53_09245 [Firmicutes bacterium]|nr:hypothetical protein [Bacillota bacterium]
MELLRMALDILLTILVVRVFVDFLPPLGASGFGRLITRLTDPLLAPVQRILPQISLGDATVDVSALVVVLLLNLVMNFIS